ncbi:glycine cleavage system aminomethyltransferase GcvT [Acidithiobacillus sp. VAN18-1]|uniref:Aminomethyltransferase n=1 Tax=Igneacidithiobacillus copahuensis TaxID=2724909 RepID=A0AAE2YNM9_9PROT|nr:glycine cleavage system aminomethyltransferase GcvT [Igneacidithiobacillus copahuensis]MBU2787344.1 glycine cleavage system aminomethyltransferase GcvT [Igneacidithiobacillus copahuensis]MBU2797363.1 glycine cleavage system aminomethyltransferase GcvT [Acidithiobacillus sp. VAN18-2]
MSETLQRTALHSWHLAHGARMSPFAGWEMPLHYGSQLREHEAVRQAAGLFDVSHMRPLDLQGPAARSLLRRALANDVARLDAEPGRALYTCMLQEDGGILDDLIVYFLGEDRYRIVLNAAGARADASYLQGLAEEEGGGVEFLPRDDWGILACQGPKAIAWAAEALALPELAPLKPFRSVAPRADLFLARTGYTGEDGIEILAPHGHLAAIADALLARGVVPSGLAARDSLRLEAGLNLYGQDMTTADSPDRSHLGWTVDLRDPKRDFIGRSAIESERRQGPAQRLWGLLLPRDAIPRHGYELLSAAGETIGTVTSGSFGPSLGLGIALARLRADVGPDSAVFLQVRQRQVPARIVEPPFWRHGQAVYPAEESLPQ